MNLEALQATLDRAVDLGRSQIGGHVATYIPELAGAPAEVVSAAIQLTNGHTLISGDMDLQKFSLQSVGKLIVLIGLLEEYGPQQVFTWVKAEPSGNDFSSVARLDQFGPMPSNPMLNAGAIALSGHIPGDSADQILWILKWTEQLFGERLEVNQRILKSELNTADKNRSLAYLLKNNGIIMGDIEIVMNTYCSLCSLEADVQQASHLPSLLANGGCNAQGVQVISPETSRIVLSVMATCGLYNESGAHLVRTGMPAKSGVSGLLVAVAPGIAGIATISPLINEKGTSVRGARILEYISQTMHWHFADLALQHR